MPRRRLDAEVVIVAAVREPAVRDRATYTRIALVMLEAFVGVGAVYGGVMLVRDSWGLPVTDLAPLPLHSWVLPGVALLVSVAAPMLAAAVLVARRHGLAADASVLAGAILAGWIVVQLAVIGPQMALQAVMFVLGLVTAALGLLLRRTERAS
jgi:hypothetical protein